MPWWLDVDTNSESVLGAAQCEYALEQTWANLEWVYERYHTYEWRIDHQCDWRREVENCVTLNESYITLAEILKYAYDQRPVYGW